MSEWKERNSKAMLDHSSAAIFITQTRTNSGVHEQNSTHLGTVIIIDFRIQFIILGLIDEEMTQFGIYNEFNTTSETKIRNTMTGESRQIC